MNQTTPPLSDTAREPAYAHWWKRVAAALVDGFLFAIASIPLFGTVLALGSRPDDSPRWQILATLPGLAVVAAFWVWNVLVRQGWTGRTLGKSALGIRLVSERTAAPLGIVRTLLRQLLHVLDGLVLDLGYLWPLWDGKRQTFADKIMRTVVVEDPAL